jgi:hypothetical protein
MAVIKDILTDDSHVSIIRRPTELMDKACPLTSGSPARRSLNAARLPALHPSAQTLLRSRYRAFAFSVSLPTTRDEQRTSTISVAPAFDGSAPVWLI